jgi:hypothetical protein
VEYLQVAPSGYPHSQATEITVSCGLGHSRQCFDMGEARKGVITVSAINNVF